MSEKATNCVYLHFITSAHQVRVPLQFLKSCHMNFQLLFWKLLLVIATTIAGHLMAAAAARQCHYCPLWPLLLAVVTSCSLALLRQNCQKRVDDSVVLSAQTETKNWKTEPISQHMLSCHDLTGELQEYHKSTVMINIL